MGYYSNAVIGKSWSKAYDWSTTRIVQGGLSPFHVLEPTEKYRLYDLLVNLDLVVLFNVQFITIVTSEEHALVAAVFKHSFTLAV